MNFYAPRKAAASRADSSRPRRARLARRRASNHRIGELKLHKVVPRRSTHRPIIETSLMLRCSVYCEIFHTIHSKKRPAKTSQNLEPACADRQPTIHAQRASLMTDHSIAVHIPREKQRRNTAAFLPF